MPDNNQNSVDLPEGILIKTGKGQYQKVQAGKITEIEKKKVKKTPLKSPDFYYHADDEEEIKIQQDKLKDIERRPIVSEPEAITEQMIQKYKLEFSDEILKKRFFNIIKSILIDVRNSIETEEILMRSTKIGGMGYDKELVYKIVQDVKNEVSKIHEFKKGEKEGKKEIFVPKIPKTEEKKEADEEISVTPPPPPITTESTEEPEVKEKKEEIKPEIKKKEFKPEIKEEIKPAEEIPYIKVKDFTAEAKPKKVEIEEKIKEIEKFEKGIPKKEPSREIQKEERSAKPSTMPRVIRPSFEKEEQKVTDIKIPKKVIGPVEELADLSVTDFRRLGGNFNEIIEKIKQKVNLLEEESFSLKTQGIEAWRNSQVNKLYLEMGRESIEKNKPIRVVAEEKKRDNLPYLNEEEFLSIADLNKYLNY